MLASIVKMFSSGKKAPPMKKPVQMQNNQNNEAMQQQVACGSRAAAPLKVRKLPFPKEDAEKDLVAVVVSLVHGSSYDALFTEYQQTAPEGKVAVYAAAYTDEALPELLAGVTAGADDVPELFAEMAQDIAAVESSAVVFNFECCSGHDHGHGRGCTAGKTLMQITRTLLDKGHMVMYSDFSLKTLIREWDEALLGPKSFKQLGTCNSSIGLAFDANELKDSDSAQLQALGKLCEESGTADVNCLGGTIVYQPLKAAASAKNDMYTRKVLTTVRTLDGRSAREGKIGHAVLEYASGGVLLTSAGHWVELQNIDTTEEAVKRVAVEQLGAADYAAFETEYMEERCSMMKKAMLQMKSAECVQRSAPCRYSKKR
eukprot:TRINITY_DN86_c0_g1_i5.p1 TRINITY_DN86_c0_g1~~TRINITY_DN86_c0_g1_i5.p1  ORF type:complete len:372 (+),score=179.45 TRINITY_DN86_c0_g1_i5:54-1169(+)